MKLRPGVPALRPLQRTLGTLVLSAGLLVLPPAWSQTAAAPNVILINLDDAGYSDFGFNGQGLIETPHIDSLAAGGAVCTQGYATASVCTPSRHGLITGRYQQRFGSECNVPTEATPGYDSSHFGVDTGEHTMGDAMRAHGYRTIAIGKWHLGEQPQYRPLNRGFDEFYGFLGGNRSYWPLDNPGIGRQLMRDNTRIADQPGGEAAEFSYLTDAFTEAAVDFIDRRSQAGEKFFIYLAYNAVHTPLHALQSDKDLFPQYTDNTRKTIAAMTHSVDRGVGQIVAALAANGIRDDTLVFFVDDNGGKVQSGSVNRPLWGYKGDKWEGGIRIPFIVNWPAAVPGGTVFDHPVSVLDILPTMMAAAGPSDYRPPNPLDGVDLVPHLRDESGAPPHEFLFWRRWNTGAVRHDRWKLIRVMDDPLQAERELLQPLRLYDIENDPGETVDLAGTHPEVARKLADAMAEWEQGLAQPRWYDGGNHAYWDELREVAHDLSGHPYSIIASKLRNGSGELHSWSTSGINAGGNDAGDGDRQIDFDNAATGENVAFWTNWGTDGSDGAPDGEILRMGQEAGDPANDNVEGFFNFVIGVGNNPCQWTGHTIKAGERFELRAMMRTGYSWTAANDSVTATLYYDDSGSPVDLASFDFSPAGGNYGPRSGSFEVPAGSPAIGKELGVRFVIDAPDGTAWAVMDAVNLEVEPPKPTIESSAIDRPLSTPNDAVVLSWNVDAFFDPGDPSQGLFLDTDDDGSAELNLTAGPGLHDARLVIDLAENLAARGISHFPAELDYHLVATNATGTATATRSVTVQADGGLTITNGGASLSTGKLALDAGTEAGETGLPLTDSGATPGSDVYLGQSFVTRQAFDLAAVHLKVREGDVPETADRRIKLELWTVDPTVDEGLMSAGDRYPLDGLAYVGTGHFPPGTAAGDYVRLGLDAPLTLEGPSRYAIIVRWNSRDGNSLQLDGLKITPYPPGSLLDRSRLPAALGPGGDLLFFLEGTQPGDLDGDGVLNDDEAAAGTGIRDVDSDDDGSEDGLEIQVLGTDPLDPNSRFRVLQVEKHEGTIHFTVVSAMGVNFDVELYEPEQRRWRLHEANLVGTAGTFEYALDPESLARDSAIVRFVVRG